MIWYKAVWNALICCRFLSNLKYTSSNFKDRINDLSLVFVQNEINSIFQRMDVFGPQNALIINAFKPLLKTLPCHKTSDIRIYQDKFSKHLDLSVAILWIWVSTKRPRIFMGPIIVIIEKYYNLMIL